MKEISFIDSMYDKENGCIDLYEKNIETNGES